MFRVTCYSKSPSKRPNEPHGKRSRGNGKQRASVCVQGRRRDASFIWERKTGSKCTILCAIRTWRVGPDYGSVLFREVCEYSVDACVRACSGLADGYSNPYVCVCALRHQAAQSQPAERNGLFRESYARQGYSHFCIVRLVPCGNGRATVLCCSLGAGRMGNCACRRRSVPVRFYAGEQDFGA